MLVKGGPVVQYFSILPMALQHTVMLWKILKILDTEDLYFIHKVYFAMFKVKADSVTFHFVITMTS